MTGEPQWKRLVQHVLTVPERVYEHGFDNRTPFGREYGHDGEAWCVIFNWCMYHDMGLDTIVPRTDSVASFTGWAEEHGQWSEYPSAGAWVNIRDGGHTEIVTGFDGTYVYTKGGNSLRTGAEDNGRGDGVWSHRKRRKDPHVTGYFAPHFPDGVCPPTADPHDRRGGVPVASYRAHTDAAPAGAPPFPGREFFEPGAVSDHALLLQTWLQRGDWGPPYKVGPSRTMTQLDLAKVRALQEHYPALAPADGRAGPLTWRYAYEVAYGLRAR